MKLTLHFDSLNDLTSQLCVLLHELNVTTKSESGVLPPIPSEFTNSSAPTPDAELPKTTAKKRGKGKKDAEPKAKLDDPIPDLAPDAETIDFATLKQALFELSQKEGGEGLAKVTDKLKTLGILRVKDIPEDKWTEVHGWAVEEAK